MYEALYVYLKKEDSFPTGYKASIQIFGPTESLEELNKQIENFEKLNTSFFEEKLVPVYIRKTRMENSHRELISLMANGRTNPEVPFF